MSRPLPLSRTVLTSTCRPASSSRRVRHNSMPLSGTCGRCVSPMCERRHLSIPYANAWSGSCRNSLSLWRFREFQPTIISRSAAFVPWSLPAKSVGAPGAPKEVRPVWGLPPSLAPGWHNNSILSTNVWLPSLPNLLWVKPEQYRLNLALDTSHAPHVYSSQYKRIFESTEQEEYTTPPGSREPGKMGTGASAVVEWTWELETNPRHPRGCGKVVSLRNVPRYRGQDIQAHSRRE